MLADRIEYVPMEVEEYLALPDGVLAEYVDGTAILMTPGTWKHNNTAARLVAIFEDQLAGIFAATEGGVRTGPRKYRYGDVAVVSVGEVPDGRFAESAPLLIVEVLSPSTRREDTVRKSHEYLSLGVGQYWLVDRDEPNLTVYGNTPDGWELVLELTGDSPTGSVAVGDHGTVELDLNALIAV